MSRRIHILANNENYHVFNRTVGNEEIFTFKRDLERAIEVIDYYRFPQKIRYSQFKTLPPKLKNDYLLHKEGQTPFVEIYSFALMPNHYHFLLRQQSDRGISTFISNFQNSFAKYFNLRNSRHGTLFQNSFKAKRVTTDEEFLHVSRYIHLNPVTSFLIQYKGLSTYPWTSFSWYVNPDSNKFIASHVLFGQFKSKKAYLHFVADQVDYQKKLATIKHLTME